MMTRSKLVSLVLVCVAAIGGIAAALIWSPKPPAVLATGTLLARGRALADFNLIDHQGRSYGTANLRGHWSLMFFGYTNCPDFCPTTLTTLAAVEKRLRAANAIAPPQVIFVSVDAKRDTPAQLAKYVPYFDPEFIGLTAADQPAIERLAREWGVVVLIEPAADGNYTVDHSGAIWVINPAGELKAILIGPFTVDALQSDIKRIVTAGA
jgi:protein SCO1